MESASIGHARGHTAASSIKPGLNIFERLEQAIGDLATDVNDAEALADRLCGPVPEDAYAQSVGDPSLLSRLDAATDRVESLRQRLSNALRRVSNRIG